MKLPGLRMRKHSWDLFCFLFIKMSVAEILPGRSFACWLDVFATINNSHTHHLLPLPSPSSYLS